MTTTQVQPFPPGKIIFAASQEPEDLKLKLNSLRAGNFILSELLTRGATPARSRTRTYRSAYEM